MEGLQFVSYLVPEGESLLLAEVEVLGVVVDELRLREPSSLHPNIYSHMIHQ
jgi:hypothetical protein